MSFDDAPTDRLRALSHPLRIRILEVLETDGPLTATEVGHHVDSSPSNCSFHLRMLDRAGLIEEVADAAGRNRPWQIASAERQMQIDVDNLDDAGRDQLRQAIVAATERNRSRALHWLDTRHLYSEEVRRATGSRQSVLRLTPDELTTIDDTINALMAPYQDRHREDIPDVAIPVAVTISVLPLDPADTDQ